MNHFPGAAFLKNDKDLLIYCNDLYAAMLDTVPDKIIGTDTSDRLPEELRERYEKENHDIISRKQIITTESAYPKEDELSYWLTYKFPIDIGSEVYIGAISLDITKQKRTEKLIKDSLEEKEFLLGELNHRIMTNVQLS
jgi:PAS domain-containing protein